MSNRLRTPRVCIGLVATLVCPLCPITALGVSFPLTWRWCNPTPHGNNIIDVAYTNQLAVQVAELGQIYTSRDLFDWTPKESHTTSALRGVTFFGDQVVIVGENGTILAGQPATDLNLIDLKTSDWLESVAASSEMAVAVGDNGAIYTSLDARSWQRQSTGIAEWLRGVAFGTPAAVGTFVTVGEDGFVALSTDGVHWAPQTRITSAHLNRVTWFSGEFWAIGESGAAFQSSSGKDWLRADSGATNVLNAFAGTDSARLLGGDSEVRLKLGRTPWSDELDSSEPVPPPVWTYLSAIPDSTNSFLLCGRTGMIVEGLLTNNVTAWVPISDSLRNWLWDTAHFPNLFLAVGDRATLLSSPDGATWDFELPPTSTTNSVFLGVGGKTNLAVVVGNAGTIITSLDTPQALISTNADGTLLTNQVSTLGIFWEPVVPRPTTNDLQGITVWNDQFVVSGGAGLILTSPDAKTWTKRVTRSTAFLSSVESFPGGLVTVGRSGSILTSPDAVNWTSRSLPTTNWIYRVRYLDGKLIAVGQNGTIATSADGVGWSTQSSGTSRWLNDVQWIDNTYFVVGNQGAVLSSPDGITWTDRGTITAKSLFGAATDGKLLITAGVEGIVLRSQVVALNTPVSFLRYPRAPEETSFLFSGQAGQRFTVDRSIDLTNWSASPILQLEPSGTLMHIDSGVNAPDRQFFRTTPKP